MWRSIGSGAAGTRAEDWPWSSTRAHLDGEDDGLVTVRPVLGRVERFAELIAAADEVFTALRAAETTGRPLGTGDFVADLERRLVAPSLGARPAGSRPAR